MEEQLNYLKLLVGTFLLLLIFGACVQTPEDKPESTITTKIPLIGFNTSTNDKAIVPATMTTEDMNYFIYCPALTGFVDSQEGINEGQNLSPQTFLSTTIEFTVSSFTDGVNGIESGVRFNGTLADGSGSITIELDTVTNNFWFEEKLFLDDPNKIIISNHSQTSKTIVYSVIEGTISNNNSGIATSKMAFYTVLEEGTKMLGLAPKCEFYFGPIIPMRPM